MDHQRVPSWEPHPAAERLLTDLVREIELRSSRLRDLADRLLKTSGVRLRDVIDHVRVPRDWAHRFEAAGWERTDSGVRRHPGGRFPAVLDADRSLELALRSESVALFVRANRLDARVTGDEHAPYRFSDVLRGAGVRVSAVERNGYAGFDLSAAGAALVRAAEVHQRSLHERRRHFADPLEGFDHTEKLLTGIIADLGPDWTCELFLRAEREYWMARCDAGRLQKSRQDAAGIGWSNIDHHTYDASRPYFDRTIALLEMLGYQCRELFYAGHQAGWGSQILEQPVIGSTIFADIDLAPHELDVDFAHSPLEPLEQHRRAGLWCAMHGESILGAGLNHVAGLYDQQALRQQLGGLGITMMKPFSDLPHLYQELTAGQWLAVDPGRVDELERGGHVDAVEAAAFRRRGAIGCHLENIERNDGFKGFNQPGIDGVIQVIDPRMNLDAAAAVGGAAPAGG
jgi:hypothetical protein